MTAPARVAALQALRAVQGASADLPKALAHSRARLSDERDRGLTAEIVQGTLRWQRALDHLIQHAAGRPLERLDRDVLLILRLSLFQLLHLSRVPAAAVVDDAVDLTRAARKGSAAGFVNAVLRATLRTRRTLPLPARPVNEADREAALAYLGITHSHPDWLVARWLDRYGFEACERWVQFNNQPPALTLRANRLRTTRDGLAASLEDDGIATAPAEWTTDGLVVLEGNPLRRPLDGSFFVQDAASQLVSLAMDCRPGERVLDLCAAPGGKTTAMAADMEDRGRIVASDVRRRRLSLLKDSIRLSGAASVAVVQVPTAGPLPFSARFDRVLVDAPCSGLGVVRRDPDIRWRRAAGDLPGLAAEQLALLDRAAAVVGKGGRLVYATCSSEPEENEDLVDAFLAEHPEFQPLDLKAHSPLPPALVDGRGALRTLPFAHGLEAFFAAAVVRS